MNVVTNLKRLSFLGRKSRRKSDYFMLHHLDDLSSKKMMITILLLLSWNLDSPVANAFIQPNYWSRNSLRLAGGATVEPTATSATTTSTTSKEIMWEPTLSYMEETAMYKFKTSVGIKDGYEELWKWSVEKGDEFWKTLLEFCQIQYTGSTTPVKVGSTMPDVHYFPNVRLNFAQNLLRYGESDSPLRHKEALVSVSEARPDKRWTFQELRDDASRVRLALEQLGVTEHDAVGAYLPNIGETIVAMLGTTSTGAIWSSCSPDFGPQAVADRFSQISPKVLFTTNGFVSKDQPNSMTDKIEELVKSLPTLKQIVVLNLIPETPLWTVDSPVNDLVISWDEFLRKGSNPDGSAPDTSYTLVPFSHPQFVLYSSGTTGLPKSIAHGAGNILLQHAKELMLHSDLRTQDRMLFFTTCGWMMWNWMTSSLFAGATVVCFDGFAAYPKLDSPWDLVSREKITHMGTTPRYLQACRRRIRPGRDNDISNLRVIFSTGSPLMAEDFEYVYQHVKKDVLLASISGGTDICSCFVLGNPLLPVRKGELQAVGLGLDVCAYDVDDGKPVLGDKAELVCRSPFVAAPVCFIGDDKQNSKYKAAYFKDEDPGVWYHGDLVEVTGSVGSAGGLVIHGRSDTTLKPGGVRIGTAEVYRFAEEVPAVIDSLVIGDQIISGKKAGDVRIVLFVCLEGETKLTPELEDEIRSTIRRGASDSHVPSLIRQVTKIPYTKSGKKVEIAVRDLFTGKEPKNVGALQDPSAFDEYRRMATEGL
jgi:acetoacetyl-CoA synthetase